MAENKKSFVLYSDLIHTVKKLVLKDRQDKTNYSGELFLHILEYVNDNDPNPIDFIVEMSFEPIKQQFKRDLKKWEKTIEIKSKGGRIGNIKRWHNDLYEEIMSKKITLEEAEIIAENRKTSHSDKNHRIPSQSIAKIAVNDSVSVSVNVNDITSTKVDVVDKEKFDNTTNDNFRDVLKFESQQWLETVSMQQKKPADFIKEKLDDFSIFLFTTEKKHPNKKEFIGHFINWLHKNLEKNGTKQQFNSGSKQQFRFNTDEAIETVTSQN